MIYVGWVKSFFNGSIKFILIKFLSNQSGIKCGYKVIKIKPRSFASLIILEERKKIKRCLVSEEKSYFLIGLQTIK